MKKSHIFGGVTAMLLASAALYAAPGAGKAKIDADGNGAVSKSESIAASDAMFAKMDVNKDGKIDFGDREAKVKEHFAEMDGDKNGSISQAEFLAAHKAREEKRGAWGDKPGAGPEGGPPKMGHGGKHRGGPGGHGGMGMKMADANGDKVITQAEFRTAAESRFAKSDTNGDGSISAAERQAQKGKGKHGKGKHG